MNWRSSSGLTLVVVVLEVGLVEVELDTVGVLDTVDVVDMVDVLDMDVVDMVDVVDVVDVVIGVVDEVDRVGVTEMVVGQMQSVVVTVGHCVVEVVSVVVMVDVLVMGELGDVLVELDVLGGVDMVVDCSVVGFVPTVILTVAMAVFVSSLTSKA